MTHFLATASEETTMHQSLEIFIDELVTDEELRDSFLHNPLKTLRRAEDWGLPLCDSEMRSLLVADPCVWDRVADELDARLQRAA